MQQLRAYTVLLFLQSHRHFHMFSIAVLILTGLGNGFFLTYRKIPNRLRK